MDFSRIRPPAALLTTSLLPASGDRTGTADGHRVSTRKFLVTFRPRTAA